MGRFLQRILGLAGDARSRQERGQRSQQVPTLPSQVGGGAMGRRGQEPGEGRGL